MPMQYKTRGMSDPRGKPRVFFSCHSEYFQAAFELLSEDILAIHNCAVWYDRLHGCTGAVIWKKQR